ncbi:MAG TPA: protein kinase, partial [Pirellulales bacterium]
MGAEGTDFSSDVPLDLPGEAAHAPEFKEFVKRLRESQLLPPGVIEVAVRDCIGWNEAEKPSVELLRRYLIDHSLITSWHIARLERGQFGGVFLGPYRLVRLVGSGGTSRVYVAEHTQLPRQVAVKVLAEEAALDSRRHRRFVREAHAFMSLDHPNIVRALHFDEAHGRPFLVMEYVEGENLREHVQRKGRPKPKQTALYMLQAADALAHLHERNFVHRDVKPANLVVTKDGEIKLLDLGLVCSTAPGADALMVSEESNVAGGSLDYIAPEQITNFHNVDHRADLYSFGCTMYFLLAGAPPFPGGSPGDKLQRHLKERPAGLEWMRGTVPDGLLTICKKLMEKKPDDRYATAIEVHRELVYWLRREGARERGEAVPTDDQQRPVTRGTRRNRLPYVPPEPAPAASESDSPVAASSAGSAAPEPLAAGGAKARRPGEPAKGFDLLDAQELSDYLRTSREVIESMAAAGAIPGRRIGGEWRFSRKAVAHWLRQSAADEPTQDDPSDPPSDNPPASSRPDPLAEQVEREQAEQAQVDAIASGVAASDHQASEAQKRSWSQAVVDWLRKPPANAGAGGALSDAVSPPSKALRGSSP